MDRPPIVVVMGVSGSGKTTLAKALAARLGWHFAEGDDFHSSANIARMRRGEALDDTDRAPWLDRIARWIEEQGAASETGVITCSALKRIYRDQLRRTCPQVVFVFCDPPIDELRRRTGLRTDHFMPGSLLDSQCAVLEKPGDDERALRLDGTGTAQNQWDTVIAWLQSAGAVVASGPLIV